MSSITATVKVNVDTEEVLAEIIEAEGVSDFLCSLYNVLHRYQDGGVFGMPDAGSKDHKKFFKHIDKMQELVF